MALIGSGTNQAFLSVFSQVKQKAQLRESNYGIVISQAEMGYTLQLLNAVTGDPRKLSIVEMVEAVSAIDIASEARVLARTVEENILDVPLFREQARRDDEHYRREIVYVDSETLEPTIFDDKPIAVGYNPTAC